MAEIKNFFYYIYKNIRLSTRVKLFRFLKHII